MTTYFVMPGEMLSGIVLDPPDTELVAFGGTAIDTTIHGGIQDDAGAATGTTIYTGYQYVEPGGVASRRHLRGLTHQAIPRSSTGGIVAPWNQVGTPPSDSSFRSG